MRQEYWHKKSELFCVISLCMFYTQAQKMSPEFSGSAKTIAIFFTRRTLFCIIPAIKAMDT